MPKPSSGMSPCQNTCDERRSDLPIVRHRRREEGVQLLELAQRAHALFESQPSQQKRKILNFVLSNCTWKGGELTAQYRKPFDLLVVA